MKPFLRFAVLAFLTLYLSFSGVAYSQTGTGSITGTVYVDLNGNGTKENGEPGLPGIKITLQGPVTDSTTTNTAGSYGFTDLPAGTYTVTQIVPNTILATEPAMQNSQAVTIAAGQTISSFDFGDMNLQRGDSSMEVISFPNGLRTGQNDITPGSTGAPLQGSPIDTSQVPSLAIRLTFTSNHVSPDTFHVRKNSIVTLGIASGDNSTHVFAFNDSRLSAVSLGVGPGTARLIAFKVYNISSGESIEFYDTAPGNTETGVMIVDPPLEHGFGPPTLASPASRAIIQPQTLSLNWDSVTGAVAYVVQVSTDTSFSSPIVQTATSQLSASISTLSYSTPYYWRVLAVDSLGITVPSQRWGFTTVAPPPIPAVPGLSNPTSGSVGVAINPALEWTSSSGATGYHLQLSTDSTFASVSFDFPSLDTNYVQIQNLSYLTKYFWRVDASNGGGTSNWSSTSSFQTVVPPQPLSPSLVSPADGSSNEPINIVLVWDRSHAAASYGIQIAVDSSFASPLKDTSGVTDTSLTLRGLSFSTKYFWHVQAKNSSGASPWTSSRYFKTAGSQLPQAPLLLSPANGTKEYPGTILFKWSSDSFSSTYQMEISTDSTFSSGMLLDTATTDTSLTFQATKTDLTYYWRVSGGNSSGFGSYSQTWSFALDATGAVSGVISSDVVWATRYSPYIISGPLLVDSSATLTIEPGVEVLFQSGSYLQVEGRLSAIGTPDSMITFNSDGPTPGGGSPNQRFSIKLIGLPSVISYASISNGSFIGMGGNHELTHSTVRDMAADRSDNGGYMGTGTIDIYSGSSIIQYDTLFDNSYDTWSGAIYLYRENSPLDLTASNNIILDNAGNQWTGGVAFSQAPEVVVNLEGNYIAGNNPDGIFFSGGSSEFQGSSFTITGNSFIGNPTYAIQFYNSSPFVSLDSNYWGSVDTSKVTSLISGYYDSFGNPVIAFPKLLSTSPMSLVPRLASVSPGQGSLGDSVIVNLSGIFFIPGISTVNAGPGIAVASVRVNDATSLTATLFVTGSATLGTHSISVTNAGSGGGTSGAIPFSVVVGPPQLNTPADSSTTVDTTTTFTWQPSSGAKSYQLQIATDTSFFHIVQNDSDVQASQYAVSGLAHYSKYYWRVRSIGSLGVSSFSPVWSFTTVVAPPPADWAYVSNTGNNATVAVPQQASVSLGPGAIRTGDAVGVFFHRNDTLVCGGYSIWHSGQNMSITVWGNNSQTSSKDGFAAGDTMHFMIWDAYAEREYTAVPVFQSGGPTYATNGLFALNSLVGTYKTTQLVALQQGWNMKSTFVEPAATSLDTIFTNLDTNLVLVKNGAGKVYWPSFGIQTLSGWDYTQGYQIYVNSPDSLIFSGVEDVPQATSIPIVQGWNMVSYLRSSQMSPDTAMSDLGSNLIIVKDNNGNVFWPAYSINTIGMMVPGEGYQLYSKQASSLTYPGNSFSSTVSGPSKSASVLAKQGSVSQRHFIATAVRTGSNATLLVRSSDLEDGDEVAVLDGDDSIVGAGVAKENRAVIAVWGRDSLSGPGGAPDGAILSLEMWSRGKREQLPLTITSLENGLTDADIPDCEMKYDPGAVWVANASSADLPKTFLLDQNYPNPFNPTTTIRYGLPKDARVRLEIYDVLGERVRVLLDENQKAGYHNVVFSGATLASGVYFCRIIAGSFVSTRKMLLLK